MVNTHCLLWLRLEIWFFVGHETKINMHGDMLCKGMVIHSSGHSFNKQAWIQKIKVIKMYRDPIDLVYVMSHSWPGSVSKCQLPECQFPRKSTPSWIHLLVHLSSCPMVPSSIDILCSVVLFFLSVSMNSQSMVVMEWVYRSCHSRFIECLERECQKDTLLPSWIPALLDIWIPDNAAS